MRNVELEEFRQLMFLSPRDEQWDLIAAKFVGPDDWINNRGPKCLHITDAQGTAQYCAKLGVYFDPSLLSDVEAIIERDGFADVSLFVIRERAPSLQ